MTEIFGQVGKIAYNGLMKAIPDCDYRRPRRLRFRDDEARMPWLSLLLDAYRVIDTGVSDAIAREQSLGRELACSKGCSSCCATHTDIPVYPLELMGMTWYLVERVEGELRERLKDRLQRSETLDACPFLVDGVCGIHPMRPIACRQFNVLDRPCAEGEDAYHTRRQDVMRPIRRYMDMAFDIMLPFYGVNDPDQRREAIEQGRLHAMARPIRACQWQNIPRRMDEWDEQQAGSRS